MATIEELAARVERLENWCKRLQKVIAMLHVVFKRSGLF